MFENLCRLILEGGARLVYTTTPAVGETLIKLKADFPTLHAEVSVNEKTAFELALASAWSGKRTACIFPASGLLEAMDPLMSSAYTGVKAAFIIACFREQGEGVTQIGLFSKLPTIASEGGADLVRAVRYAFGLSEQYEIPCLIETAADADAVMGGPDDAPEQKARFVKEPGRWAATPGFRYQLHRVLNEKMDRIRTDFETYPGNELRVNGRAGLITHRASGRDETGAMSCLRLGTVFPLPLGVVTSFIERMDGVVVDEGLYPTIELQIPDRAKVKGRLMPGVAPSAAERAGERGGTPPREERLFGYRVVRDVLGPASSINIAHGIVTSGGEGPVLAITDEDAFLHSGMPAFINTLYNGSSYVLAIRTQRKRQELERILKGYGFENYAAISRAEETEGQYRADMVTVLFCEGAI